MNSASVLGINFYVRQVERQQVELYSTAPCTVFNMILEVIKLPFIKIAKKAKGDFGKR